MSSSTPFKHTVTEVAPDSASIGDEYYNPVTNQLFKRLVHDAKTVKWVKTGVLANTGSGISILRQTGSVLQTVSTTLNTFGSTSSTSYVAVNGLSVSITPSNTSNQVLVRGYIWVATTGQQGGFAALFRGGSIVAGVAGSATQTNAIINGTSGTTRASGGFISLATAVGYTSVPLYFEFLDNPASISSQTYQIYVRTGASGTLLYNYQNQTGTDANFGYYASTITAQEIAV